MHAFFNSFCHALSRVAQHAQRARCAFAYSTQCLHGDVGEGLEQCFCNPVLGTGSSSIFFAALRWRCATIDQRHGHRDQGNTVGNAVVNAHNHGAAPDAVRAGVVLDQVDLPQRAFGVQPLGGQRSHAVLQGWLLVAAGTLRSCGQFVAHDVVGQVKVAIFDPGRTSRIFDHALFEAVVFQQAALNAFAHRCVLDARGQLPDAHNHHQVGIAVHP